MASTTPKQLLKQLKDKDPEERKRAIKALARKRERSALRQLALMSGDDKDAEVRDLALKAGQFILAETGGLNADNDGAPPPLERDAKGRIKRVHVSDEDTERAKILMQDAMTAVQSDSPAKAMRALAKALQLDPNLRTEAYFISLAERASGKEGEDAVALLYDKSAHDAITQSQAEEIRQRHLDEHALKISKFRWNDVGFDFVLVAIFTSLAMIVVGLITTTTAMGYVDRIDQNIAQIQVSTLITDEEDPHEGEYLFVDPLGEAEPVYIAAIDFDPDFVDRAETIGQTPALSVVGAGLGFGVGVALLLLVMAGITHGVASLLLAGNGDIRFTAHGLAALMMNRAVVIGVLSGIAAMVVINSGGGTMQTVFMAIIGLVVAQMVFKLVQTVADAYDFSFPQALLSTAAGATVFAVAGFVALIAL